jgi:hypothetical protein
LYISGSFLGVQVVEVAEELVEAVHRRQVLVPVGKVVLAELAGGVALLVEERRDGHDLVRHADRRGGNADLREPGPVDALPSDERRPAGGARLLAVRVGEHHAFPRDPVDVRRAVAHQAMRVAGEVGDADVVTPDHQDVRLLRISHRVLPWCGVGPRMVGAASCWLDESSDAPPADFHVDPPSPSPRRDVREPLVVFDTAG